MGKIKLLFMEFENVRYYKSKAVIENSHFCNFENFWLCIRGSRHLSPSEYTLVPQCMYSLGAFMDGWMFSSKFLILRKFKQQLRFKMKL